MSDNFAYKCSTCDHVFSRFAEVIDYIIARHPNDETRFLKLLEKDLDEATVWQTKRFAVTTSSVKTMDVPMKETLKFAKLQHRSIYLN